MKISKYGKIVLFITLLDLLTTLIFINAGIGGEANLLLKLCFDKGGDIFFTVVKMLSVGVPVFFAELALKKSWVRPKIVNICYVVVIIGYLTYYIAGTVIVNFSSIRALFS